MASGPLDEVARAVKTVADRGEQESVLIFDDCSSQLIELDLRGTVEEALERLSGTDLGPADGPMADATSRQRGPGRPRLGVVSREVTLLPRH